MRRGLSQGGRWVFKKVVEEKLHKHPLRSSAPLFGHSDAEPAPSPICRSLTSDVSKIPNARTRSVSPTPRSSPEQEK